MSSDLNGISEVKKFHLLRGEPLNVPEIYLKTSLLFISKAVHFLSLFTLKLGKMIKKY